MWETQNDKIGAAVKIQKTVRGNQARRSLDGGGGGRGRETTVGLLMRTDLTKAGDALCAQPPSASFPCHPFSSFSSFCPSFWGTGFVLKSLSLSLPS